MRQKWLTKMHTLPSKSLQLSEEVYYFNKLLKSHNRLNVEALNPVQTSICFIFLIIHCFSRPSSPTENYDFLYSVPLQVHTRMEGIRDQARLGKIFTQGGLNWGSSIQSDVMVEVTAWSMKSVIITRILTTILGSSYYLGKVHCIFKIQCSLILLTPSPNTHTQC